jgi:hypothetical protein
MRKLKKFSGKMMFYVFISLVIVSVGYPLAVYAKSENNNNGDPQNPSLFEKRAQYQHIVAFFAVDPDIAYQWVPPSFDLVLDTDAPGMATGVVVLLHSPVYSFISTPNSPPLEEGENFAPDSVVHFWFQVEGPAEVPHVPGAMIDTPTGYYYSVVDLVTSSVAHSLFRRAGRPAVLVRDITFIDEGQDQTVEITFLNGKEMVVEAYTPYIAPGVPLNSILGGNVWQYHVGGNGKMGNDSGVSLDPANGNSSNLSTTKVQYLGLMPGVPLTTQVEIDADPGTIFEDCFGMTYVVASRGVLFSPNNVVLNGSRGELLWTDYPSPEIPVPPDLPEP